MPVVRAKERHVAPSAVAAQGEAKAAGFVC